MTASSASLSSASELRPGEVHLWLARAGDAAALDSSVLCPSELARREAAVGRCWLRHLLSRYADTAPGDWVFATGEHGKPALLNQGADLQFNLSHSGEWLAAAVSREGPLGVDVQIMDAGRAVRRLARRYYSGAEQASLEAMADGDYVRHFYRLWSLKEAWTKARGAALPGALGTVDFSIEGESLLSRADEALADTSLWLLELPRYSLALCALRAGLRVRAWEWPGQALRPPLVASLGTA